jgi:hypothetical protein
MLRAAGTAYGGSGASFAKASEVLLLWLVRRYVVSGVICGTGSSWPACPNSAMWDAQRARIR